MNAPALPKAHPIEFVDDEHDAAWLEARYDGIGGSEIASVLGISPWVSPMELHLRKRKLVTDPVEETEAMRWGTVLEAPVRDEFSTRSGVSTLGFPHKVIYRSTELEIAQASPDGLVGPKGFKSGAEIWETSDISGWYEGKTAWRYGESWVDEDRGVKVPLHYEAQCQWELAVSGLPVCWLAVLLPGPKFLYLSIEAQPLVQADLFAAAERFWHDVEHGVMPDIDGSESTTSALKSAFGKTVVEDSVELPERFLADARRLARLKATAKRIEEATALIENRFRVAMGEHKVACIDGEKVASWPLIAASHVEAHDKAAYRRLTVTPPKEK